MFIIKDDPNICDFVAEITAGDYDDKLDQLKAEFIEVIRRRQAALVAEIDKKHIFIHLDLDHRNLQGKKYSAPHFNYGSGLGVPISCVSKLEA
jgi:hypothetical protein